MYPLLETLKIQDGRICNLGYHNRRFNASREALYGEGIRERDLAGLIRIPDALSQGTYRCRIRYGKKIGKVEFIPHRTRTVKSLRLIPCDKIDYSLKYADRSLLESLFALREGCDEILIVKNGFLSDTSTSNIVFRRRDGSWVTPDTPLLNGTMRMYLLDAGRIRELPIRPEDLPEFTGARTINCMTGLDSGPLIEMDQIFG